MRFYLGTHIPAWLPVSDVSLFVSAVTLRKIAFLGARHRGGEERRHRLRDGFRARAPWALDSGGFSEIAAHGRWTVEPRVYVAEVRRWSRLIGKLEWAAIQDWMCEPVMLTKTGLTVREHQIRTVESFATLRGLAPEIPWTPVLQGWQLDDYLAHLDMYADAGFDLRAEPIVGVGSVCRRQGTHEAAGIMRALSFRGIRIHAFGIKTQGIALFGDWIETSDSLAWSFSARREQIQLPGHTHKNCANCFEFAMQWRRNLFNKLGMDDGGARQAAMPW